MLTGLPRYCSASGMFAEARVDDFHAIMRKRVSSLMRRVRGGCNGLLNTIGNILTVSLAGFSRQGITLPPLGSAKGRQECLNKYADFKYIPEVKYCDTVFDSFLCWGPTPAGETATQSCPPARLSDTSRMAFRLCDETGKWVGRRPNESNAIGWTNYTPCFSLEVQTLFDKVDNENSSHYKFEIAHRTRYLEIVGFSISLVALLSSLFLLTYFRSLHNNRTKIHKSLFIAMLLQVAIRLVLYIDQFLVRGNMNETSFLTATIRGIDNMPYLCEISYFLLEYAITVMFMWMFIEGLYLNNLVTVNVFSDRMSYRLYFVVGWGVPLLLSIVWAVFTALHYARDDVNRCWYGYNFLPIYWIIQGPRLAVILINLMFLLNILKVLVLKLRRSESTEVNRIRKAVRAAFVLLPLLGITNVLDMIEAPLDGSVWQFALWSYTTHFLRSFQGLFIAMIYCFLNAEVRMVLKKHFENQRAMRETRRRHASLFRNNGRRPATPANRRRIKMKSEGTQTKIPLRQMRWSRGRAPRLSLADVQISMPSIEENKRSTGTHTDPYIATTPALMDIRRASCGAAVPITTTVTIENDFREPPSMRHWKEAERQLREKQRRKALKERSNIELAQTAKPKTRVIRSRQKFKTQYQETKIMIEEMDDIQEYPEQEMETKITIQEPNEFKEYEVKETKVVTEQWDKTKYETKIMMEQFDVIDENPEEIKLAFKETKIIIEHLEDPDEYPVIRRISEV